MAGRVLRKENEKKLRTAMQTLADILAELGDDDKSDEAKESAAKLQEAANLGNWLEARLHLSFTEIADMLFGDGYLTREERIGLSSAIGAGLTAFNAAIQETMPHIYQRGVWEQAVQQAGNEVAESVVESECLPLVERALRSDGTARIRIIKPGWGSSGYYPAEVLKRDGPKIFIAGTKQYWNHATPTEEAERPEGDLETLAGELVSDARWENDDEGGGLYADTKVFGRFQGAVNELAPHIGVSIRAMGKHVMGEADGRRGAIITDLTSAKSIDYVTVAGAGGKVIEMFEAARIGVPVKKPTTEESMTAEETAKLTEAENKIARLQEALLLRDARDFVAAQVAGADIPDVTKSRLIESLAKNPAVKDGALDTAVFAEQIKTAVESERTYLQQAAGVGNGKVQGMGGQTHQNNSGAASGDVVARMTESFRRMGLSEDAAKVAANGRNY